MSSKVIKVEPSIFEAYKSTPFLVGFMDKRYGSDNFEETWMDSWQIWYTWGRQFCALHPEINTLMIRDQVFQPSFEKFYKAITTKSIV